jgi:hypothetical protein
MFVRILGACFVLLLIAGPALPSELKLKRVMLSSGGVAYLEHEAVVVGDADLSLDVCLSTRWTTC